MSSNAGLPHVRRIVTGHTSSGKAIFVSDEEFTDTIAINPGDFKPSAPPPPMDEEKASRFTHLFMTANHSPLPSNEAGSSFVDIAKTDQAQAELLVPNNGSVVRMVDMPPKSASPFHRTISLDYAVVVQGTVVSEIDDGARKELRVGDVFVQRGTMHKWINESETDWARIFFVMLTSNPVKIDGNQELKTDFRF